MRHEDIQHYNWDDGIECMWPVVEDPHTDKGTALLLYWRLEGPFLGDRHGEYNHDLWRMNQVLRERICSGFYKRADIPYDPVADSQLSKLQVAKLLRSGVNEILLTPVAGKNRLTNGSR